MWSPFWLKLEAWAGDYSFSTPLIPALATSLSKMDPTPAELQAMRTIEAVVAFVPMDAALAATFYAELGLEPAAPLRSLAAIEKEDLVEARSKMKLGDVALNAAAKGKVVTAWPVSRSPCELKRSPK